MVIAGAGHGAVVVPRAKIDHACGLKGVDGPARVRPVGEDELIPSVSAQNITFEFQPAYKRIRKETAIIKPRPRPPAALGCVQRKFDFIPSAVVVAPESTAPCPIQLFDGPVPTFAPDQKSAPHERIAIHEGKAG